MTRMIWSNGDRETNSSIIKAIGWLKQIRADWAYPVPAKLCTGERKATTTASESYI